VLGFALVKLVLLELVFVIFLNIEHVVLRQMKVFTSSIYISAAAKRSRVTSA
jgi:hypothetical protein